MISPGSLVVAVIAGSGLKYPPVLKEFRVSLVSVELDQLRQVLEAVMKLGDFLLLSRGTKFYGVFLLGNWFNTFFGVFQRDTRLIFSAKNLKRLE